MSHAHPPRARRAFTRFIATLCAGGLVAGIGVCLLQGQGAKARHYAAAAQVYHAQSLQGNLSLDSVAYLRGAAREAALQSLSHDPAQPHTWAMLSDILLQSQSYAAAAETRNVAVNMGFKAPAGSNGFAAVVPATPASVQGKP